MARKAKKSGHKPRLSTQNRVTSVGGSPEVPNRNLMNAVGTRPATEPPLQLAPAAGNVARTVVNNRFEVEPGTLGELLNLSGQDPAKIDVARMNLLCATGLPTTRGLDVEYAVSVIDEWSGVVAYETDRHLYRIHDPRFKEHYRGSEAHLRAEMLAQVLHEDLGVRYNPKAVGNFSFADPSVAFIHGMIPARGKTVADTPGGTCATMPVLYVAVGRRLGYPLKLSATQSHVFARWDGLDHPVRGWRERFNCEMTNGFNRFDDAYYRRWPKPLSEADIKRNGLLRSLTPAQELAMFMAARGHHGVDIGRFRFACRSYENACLLDRGRQDYLSWLMTASVECGYRPETPWLRKLVPAALSGRDAGRVPSAPNPLAGLGLPEHLLDRANPYSMAPPDPMTGQARVFGDPMG
ncbi:MAG: hypothetical protein AAGH88_07970 [Planctomycetota bacterium]